MVQYYFNFFAYIHEKMQFLLFDGQNVFQFQHYKPILIELFLIKYVPPLILVNVDTICPLGSTAERLSFTSTLAAHGARFSAAAAGLWFLLSGREETEPRNGAPCSLVRRAAVACNKM